MNYNRACELLEEVTVENQWLAKNTYGVAIFEDKHIVVNTALCVVDTLLHELIHIDDPEKKEKVVLEETIRSLQSMKVEEIVDLFDRFVQKLKEANDASKH